MTTTQWSRSNRYRTGSNAITDQAQGGGNKKAGFPYQVGRDSWASIAIPKTSLPFVMNTKFPLARFSRPIGGDVRTVYFSGIGKH
jgi:hypothetical protein